MGTIQDLRVALKSRFAERNAVIDGLLVALISRETCFILGSPGTAKSAVCEAITGAIGGTYFQWLLTKFTTPDEVYGPPSFTGLKSDRCERVTTGKLPEASVAFIDEIFKGSSAIINTLLPVINERKFFNGTSTQSVPLETFYCASNEIPQAEELAALYDRLTLKFEVKRLSGGAFRSFITKDFLKVQIPTLDKGELEKARKATETVTIPDNVLNAIASIAGELEQSGIYVSDRKWFKIIEVLKAYSVLNGATEVAEDDLEIVAHCAWHTPDQFKTVEKIVNKFSNPLGETLLQHRDNLDEVVALLDSGKLNAVEGHKKALDCAKALKALAGKHPANRKVAETFTYAQAAVAKITKEKLGIDLSI